MAGATTLQVQTVHKCEESIENTFAQQLSVELAYNLCNATDLEIIFRDESLDKELIA